MRRLVSKELKRNDDSYGVEHRDKYGLLGMRTVPSTSTVLVEYRFDTFEEAAAFYHTLEDK